MGNICTSNEEKFEATETVDYKNSLKLSVILGKNCSIDLITGNFRQHKSDSLLVIIENTSLENCDPLRQYTSEPQKITQIIASQRSNSISQEELFYKVPSVSKSCPYKKLFLAILPKYSTEDAQQYQQHFRNIISQLLSHSKDFTLELSSTTEGISQLPNQMQLQQVKPNIKLSLISNDKKMINLYKYELLKTEACQLRFFDNKDPL